MSRIGRLPITIPAGVDVKIGAENEVTVKGAKATLTRKLHPDMIVKVENGVITSTEGKEWQWTHGSKWNYFETTIDGIKYNVYYADYYKALDAHATTEQLLQGVYLDKTFDMKDNVPYAFGEKFDVDSGWDWSKVSCPVFAVAVQAAGFDSASAAMDAAFGANYNPFGGEATNWQ